MADFNATTKSTRVVQSPEAAPGPVEAGARIKDGIRAQNKLIEEAQELLTDYLRPDGPRDCDETCTALLELLDGPGQREVRERARLAIEAAEQIAMTPAVAWLVERGGKWWRAPYSYSRYMLSEEARIDDFWTTDASAAVRFARRGDAEALIRYIGAESSARATEHVWLGSATPAPEDRTAPATPQGEPNWREIGDDLGDRFGVDPSYWDALGNAVRAIAARAGSAPSSGAIAEALAEMRRAINALQLEVSQTVYIDVSVKVEAAIAAITQREREECAKVVEGWHPLLPLCKNIAAAIRARKP